MTELFQVATAAFTVSKVVPGVPPQPANQPDVELVTVLDTSDQVLTAFFDFGLSLE